MSGSSGDVPPSELIDRIADEFESQWEGAAAGPQIVQFLVRAPVGSREKLLGELIRVDWEIRCKRGLTPTLADYRREVDGCGELGLPAWLTDDWWRQFERTLSSPGTPSPDDTRSLDQTSPLLRLSALDRVREEIAEPTEIGPYHIIAAIGEGGMGTVYKAEQRHPIRRVVALKVIKLGMDSKRVVARFYSEQQALTMMDHPHIAKVLEAGITGRGQPYFVMEFVPGEPITAYCDRQKLDVRQRLSLFCDVCSAIQHSHTKGIIHRDIKPGNVLVSVKDGEPLVKVIDFGVAKATQSRLVEQTLYTEQGATIGTPEYMSPEQAENNQLDIDTRSDVYSLGVLLYELLSGCLPFESKTLRARGLGDLQRMIREEDAPRPSTRLASLGDKATEIAENRRTQVAQLARQLRGELECVPLKALEKDRTRRYQTATALQDDVANYLNGRPLVAGPVSALYRARKLVVRNRGRFAATTTAILAIIAAVGIYILSIRAERQRTLVESEHAKHLAGQLTTALADATASTRETQVRLAEGLVSQGDALVLAGHWFEAHATYREAYAQFTGLQASSFKADAALMSFYAASPPALLTFRGHASTVRSVAFSADDRTALSGGADKLLRLWDLQTGLELRSFRGHTRAVTSVALSADGSTALSGSDDRSLKLWDVKTAREVRSLQGHSNKVLSVALSRDGLAALSGSADGTLKLWDLQSGQPVHTLEGHAGYVWSVALSHDGRIGLSGSQDQTLKVWDLQSGREICTLSGHTDAVLSVALSPDGRTALSGSADKTVKRWDTRNGREIRTFRGHMMPVTSVAFSPDGRTALSGSDDKTLKLWDLETGENVRTLQGHTHAITAVALSPDGRTALSGSTDKTLKLWSTEPGREIRTLKGHLEGVNGVAVSADGRAALSASKDRTLKLWDLQSGRVMHTFEGHTDSVTSVALSQDAHTALSGSLDKSLRVWDVQSGRELRTLQGHKEGVLSVALSADARTALSGSGSSLASTDNSVKVWDLQTGHELYSLDGHTGAVLSVARSLDGRTALSGSADHTLKLWDLQTGREIRTLAGHTRGVSGVTLSPDGRSAISGSWDGTLRIWDLQTGRETRAIPSYSHWITSVAVRPDGHAGFSASEDKTVKLWDLQSARELRTFEGHAGFVLCVALSADGNVAVSASDDKTLKVWDFTRTSKYAEFDQSIPRAQAALQKNPGDAGALAVLGNWYAFRGHNDWAVDLLERARTGGAAVDALRLADCYWELSAAASPSGSSGFLAAARREFRTALSEPRSEADRFYAALCLGALEQ